MKNIYRLNSNDIIFIEPHQISTSITIAIIYFIAILFIFMKIIWPIIRHILGLDFISIVMLLLLIAQQTVENSTPHDFNLAVIILVAMLVVRHVVMQVVILVAIHVVVSIILDIKLSILFQAAGVIPIIVKMQTKIIILIVIAITDAAKYIIIIVAIFIIHNLVLY